MLPSPRLYLLLGARLGYMLTSAQNLPTKLAECEGNQCAPGGGGGGTWTFEGRQGTAQWPYGARANLTIERFDFDGVIIRRADYEGTTPGLTALYTGKIRGNRIEGDVTWSWPGHWSRSPVGKWFATFDETGDVPDRAAIAAAPPPLPTT